MAEFRDQSGQPGPSTWKGGAFPDGQAEFPVGGVSWYEAAAYARFAGMQLPTSLHWSSAAMRSAREAGWLYGPSSNLNGSGVRRTGLGTISAYGLYDVNGNVREWNTNAVDSGRLTRGGTWEDSPFQTGHLIPRPAFDRAAANGFRVARYNDPDSVVARLSAPIQRNLPRDFRTFVAVSDAEFAGYRRLYDYDKPDLGTKLEDSGELRDARWQKLSFTAGYKGPRMAVYLIYPKNANGPFEPVILWEHAGVLVSRKVNLEDRMQELYAGFLQRSGRMIVLPLYMGTYERDDSTFSITQSAPDSTTYYRDLTVQWIKDLRRTVDFLETRKDVLSDRIGFYSVSWGGLNAPIALAMEPRIKAAVLSSAGFAAGMKARAEVDAANYAPRVHTPVLMLNGKYDTVYPYETSQVPFFKQLGTRASDKNAIISDNGHMVSLETSMRESLAWFDKYLSGKTSNTLARK